MLDIIYIVFGSLLNLLPYAILCYLPFFHRLTLKVSKKTVATYLLLLSAVTIVSAMPYANSSLNVPDLWTWFQNTLLIIFMAVYYLTVKASATKLFFVFFLVSSYGYGISGISHFILANIFPEQFYILYSPVSSLSRFVLLLVTYPFVIIYLRRCICPALHVYYAAVWKYLWLIPTIFLAINNIYTGTFDISTISSLQYLSALLLILFGSFFVCYLAVKMIEQTDFNVRLEKITEDLTSKKKTRDAFFQNVAHDLRTPISVIRTAADILSESEMPPPERRLVARITGRVAQLENMVEDIMRLSVLESGDLSFKLEIINIGELLHTVHDGYFSICEKQGVALNITACQGVIHSDRHRILEVFDNLITNALFHTLTGTIFISAKEENGYCVFSVRDTGTGIPEKDLPFIFDRFFKGLHSKNGSGLGLCICKEILEHLGGTIWAVNYSEKGAVFMFKIKMYGG